MENKKQKIEKENIFILFILQIYNDVVYFKVPEKEVIKKVLSLTSGYPIHGNSCYFDQRFIIHEYFGFGLDSGFNSIDDISDKEKKKMDKIKKQKPIFENYLLKEPFNINPKEKAHIIILTSET